MIPLRILAAAVLLSATAAEAAPQSYLGKTIRVTWNEARSQRDRGEVEFKPVSLPFTFTVYVSTKGEIFRRTHAFGRSSNVQGKQDRVGAGGNTADGATKVTFQGNTLNASSSSTGGFGRRIRVTLNGSSCAADVLSGKTGNGIISVRSVATGNFVEFQSVSAGPATCSVQDGNAFAD